MPNVFITKPIFHTAADRLHQAGFEVSTGPADRKLTPDELREVAASNDAIICLLNNRITADLLREAPRCRIYANYAVGFDNMDVAAATAAGVALCNTPDVLTAATAEIAWALLFAVARRVCEGDRMTRARQFHGWEPDMLLGHEVSGKTLGIIGAGRIGTAMAKRAMGFDMKILYTRRSGPSDEMTSLGGTCVQLEQLLKESDFISVHAPLTSDTKHMISDKQFKMMKPSSILINTGRGPIIDEAALVRALQDGQIWGAGLDVYEREPEIEEGLLKLDNVVLAPHIGSATYTARAAMASLAADNIIDYFAGQTPRTCLNPEYRNNVRKLNS